MLSLLSTASLLINVEIRGLSPLAAVDAVEEVNPVRDSRRHTVKFHTIDESKWSSVDALASGVLPDLTDLPGSIVGVIWSVDGLDVGFVETKFISYLLRPPRDEVVLGGVSHGQNCWLHLEREVLILVLKATLGAIG